MNRNLERMVANTYFVCEISEEIKLNKFGVKGWRHKLNFGNSPMNRVLPVVYKLAVYNQHNFYLLICYLLCQKVIR